MGTRNSRDSNLINGLRVRRAPSVSVRLEAVIKPGPHFYLWSVLEPIKWRVVEIPTDLYLHLNFEGSLGAI